MSERPYGVGVVGAPYAIDKIYDNWIVATNRRTLDGPRSRSAFSEWEEWATGVTFAQDHPVCECERDMGQANRYKKAARLGHTRSRVLDIPTPYAFLGQVTNSFHLQPIHSTAP